MLCFHPGTRLWFRGHPATSRAPGHIGRHSDRGVDSRTQMGYSAEMLAKSASEGVLCLPRCWFLFEKAAACAFRIVQQCSLSSINCETAMAQSQFCAYVHTVCLGRCFDFRCQFATKIVLTCVLLLRQLRLTFAAAAKIAASCIAVSIRSLSTRCLQPSRLLSRMHKQLLMACPF